MTMILHLLLLATLANAQTTKYVVDDYNKQGGIQAYKMDLDDKFSVRGGTVTGKAVFTKAPILNSGLVANGNVTVAVGGVVFRDGTIQVSAGVVASTINVNHSQFSGDGSDLNALTLQPSSVTLQGNSFNSAGELVQINQLGLAPISIIGSAGSALIATNLSGGSAGQIHYQSANNVTAMLDAGSVGYVLTGAGVASPTWTLSTSANTPGSIVVRDSNGDFYGNNISGVKFYGDGSGLNNITVSSAHKAVFGTLTITGDVRSLNVIQ